MGGAGEDLVSSWCRGSAMKAEEIVGSTVTLVYESRERKGVVCQYNEEKGAFWVQTVWLECMMSFGFC